MSISVQNISISFGDQRALNSLTFDIQKGESVGLLGPNGSGKTTLMKILSTYQQSYVGQAIVNSFDVQKDKKNVGKSIGYLPEYNTCDLDMCAKEYIGFNANVYKMGHRRISEVIEKTGLSFEAHKKIGQLSNGNRQRVGLAVALLHNPDVLLLDEPTIRLDPDQQLEIRELIRTIGKEKTILLATQNIREVEELCDRVLIIHKGELVADKKLSELRKVDGQIIEVEFDYRVEEAFLHKLPNVSKVQNTGGFSYDITFDTSIDMRPTVFDFAHDHQLKTLYLSPKHVNLEALFTALTI